MKQDYFVYNGKRYNTETQINIRWLTIPGCKYSKRVAKFISYNTDDKTYTFKIEGGQHTYSENDFYKIFLGITGEPTPKTSQHRVLKKATFKDELNINGLLMAWIWYVFIMAVSIIFNGRIAIWIAVSVIFFDYRQKKLKEAGYQ